MNVGKDCGQEQLTNRWCVGFIMFTEVSGVCPVNLVRTYQLQASIFLTMLVRGILSTISA